MLWLSIPKFRGLQELLNTLYQISSNFLSPHIYAGGKTKSERNDNSKVCFYPRTYAGGKLLSVGIDCPSDNFYPRTYAGRKLLDVEIERVELEVFIPAHMRVVRT